MADPAAAAAAEGPLLVKSPASEGLCTRIARFYIPRTDDGDTHVNELLQHPWFTRWLKFLPALIITYALEVANGSVLSTNADWLNQHFILVVFVPVISAIAGNIGLQTSSSVTAKVNVDQKEGVTTNKLELLLQYQAHNLPNILVMALIMALTVMFWDGSVCRDDHAGVVFVGSLVNMGIASLMGVVTPLLAHGRGYDPSALAGPFETALQDVIGFMVFIWLAKIAIQYVPPNSCILGDCVTLCATTWHPECMATCNNDLDCYKAQCMGS